jgi:hypothetical protein
MSINDRGQIVLVGSQFNCFVDSGGTYTAINVPGTSFTYALGINDSGQVTGYSSLGPYIYSSGSYNLFSILGATESVGVNGISNSGQIVGSFQVDVNTNLEHPAGFIYTNGTVQTYDPGTSGAAFLGINSSGKVVGDTSTGQAFLYDSRSGTVTPISIPGANEIGALGINDSGQIVGQFSTNTTHGYIESGGQFRIINYPTGPDTVNVNTVVTGINNEGQFVGYTTYDRVPEPSTFSLLGIGLFGLAILGLKRS